MWNEELKDSVAYNPLMALERAQTGQNTIEGLVPRGGVTWLYGPSMSFKSFIVMSMAAAVSTGNNWMGRRTEQSVVVYVGAEGGDALHVRRAGAELACAANVAGFIAVAQERPMLDREVGLFHMRGLLGGVSDTVWAQECFHRAVDAYYDGLPDVLEARDRESDCMFTLAGIKKTLAGTRGAVEARIREMDERGDIPAGRYQEAVDKNTKIEEDAAKAALAAAEADLREAEAARVEAERVAQSRDARVKAYGSTKDRYAQSMLLGIDTPHRNIFCIIDTYAQTADDDTRASVSAYIKNLRALVEEAQADGVTLTFLVVDHVTKEGGTYLGSVAKINDVDSQIEVARVRKSMLATVAQTKSKDAVECPPINIEMKRFDLAGYKDSAGQPLSTLVARDGAHTASVAALNPEGNAAMLLELLHGAEGLMSELDLKAAFRDAKIIAGVKPESADKAYRRAMQALRDDGCVRDLEGEISLT